MATNESTPDQKTIVVLGMHRSGTSMMGAVLEALGVNMGDEFREGARANPLGFFEDLTFKELNRDMLHAAQGDMYDAPPREAILAHKGQYVDRIQQVVSSKTSARWGWKDPRTSLTVELYLDYLVNPHIVYCRRSKDAVAKSLETRGDMTFADAISLAEEYEKRIVSFLDGNPDIPRLTLTYEAMTSQPKEGIQQLILFLELHSTDTQIERALGLVLPKRAIQRLRFKRLVEKGLQRPWEIPGYIYKRIRYRFLERDRSKPQAQSA